MSRRHNASRRRAYGRRQHEVRERRPETAGGTVDWADLNTFDDMESGDDFSLDSPPPRARDRFSGAHP